MANTYSAILDRLPIIQQMGTDALTNARQLAAQKAMQYQNSLAYNPNTSISSGGQQSSSPSIGQSQGSYSGGPGRSLYQALINGGFSPQAARIMYGIAGAESAYNPNALGDIGLQNSTWGPSYGYFQIRTLRGDTGTGRVRDINWLRQGGLQAQIKAAYDISNGGRNFNPWSTYLHGSYTKFLPSFASGNWNLPQDTVAQLHQGEMIVPPQAAEVLRRILQNPAVLGIQQVPQQGGIQGPISSYVLPLLQGQGQPQ